MFIRKLASDKSDLILISNTENNRNCFNLMFFGDTDTDHQHELKIEFANLLKSTFRDKATLYGSADYTRTLNGIGAPSGTST